MGDYNIDINVNMGGSDQNATFKSLTEAVQQLNVNLNNVGAASKSAGSQTKSSFEEAMRTVAQFKDGIGGLEREILKTKQAILSENEALRKGVITQVEYDANIRKLTSDYKTLTSAQRQYNSLIDQTRTKVESLTSVLNKFGAVLGVSAGLYGVFRAFQYGIKILSDFDLAQKKLQSILAVSAKDMQDISKSAIEIGKSSIFGAKGVTELQIELAKMGFTKMQIMDMQSAIVNLATATQEDLASSAEVVANIIRAYNLTASEATRVTDIMGKAFNDSALDLANFREAIKYVAPIAAQANFKFEETVALLEQLSNAGIKGSLAGTGLTNIISRLGNENSKFSKTLGRTVNGFDDFIKGLIELKKRGTDLGDTFELVDRRAAATFTILLGGVDTVEQFKKKLEESNGVMQEQANVQLQSISYSAKLAKNAFDSFILSIDNGTSVLSDSLRTIIGEFTAVLNIINAITTKVDTTDWQQLSEKISQLVLNASDKFSQSFEDATDKMSKVAFNAFDVVSLILFGKSAKLAKSFSEGIESGLKEGKDAVDKQVYSITNGVIGIWEKQFGENFYGKKVPELLAKFNKMLLTMREGTLEHQQLSSIINELNKRYEAYLKNIDLKIQKEGKDESAAKKAKQLAIERLQAEKAALISNAQLIEDDAKRQLKIADLTYEYDLKILRLSEQDEKTFELKRITIVNDYIAKKQELYKKGADGINDIEEKLLKEQLNRINKEFEERSKINDAIFKDFQDKTEALSKWKIENPFLDVLFGEEVKNKLFGGIINEDELDEWTSMTKDAFSEIGDQITGLADAWVEATDKIVDQLNRQIDETQSALDTEAELMTAGYANNVTLKRKELEELKKARKEAQEDQFKAQKVQLALETSEQIASLSTTVAYLLKDGAKLGFLGIPIAIAAIATVFTAFSKFKALAKEQAATKFAKGGWIGGKSHAEGGTPIEAEKGEFVIRKSSAMKHKSLIEAINMDDSVRLNRIYLDKLRSGVLNHRVSLDDSKYVKGIYDMMSKPEKQVTYYGEYRIEKYGNITKKVKISQN